MACWKVSIFLPTRRSPTSEPESKGLTSLSSLLEDEITLKIISQPIFHLHSFLIFFLLVSFPSLTFSNPLSYLTPRFRSACSTKSPSELLPAILLSFFKHITFPLSSTPLVNYCFLPLICLKNYYFILSLERCLIISPQLDHYAFYSFNKYILGFLSVSIIPKFQAPRRKLVFITNCCVFQTV